MIIKIIILLLILGIIYCLATGLYYLFKNEQKSKSLAKALTWRVVLSLTLFLLLLIAFLLGLIHPHGIEPPEWS